MKNIRISIVMSDDSMDTILSETQFEIPEIDLININEIEDCFLKAEKPTIRKSIAEYLCHESKKKPKL